MTYPAEVEARIHEYAVIRAQRSVAQHGLEAAISYLRGKSPVCPITNGTLAH